MELYYGVILMKRIPGIPVESQEPSGTHKGPWDPLGTPLGPPGTPLALQWAGTPLGLLETPTEQKNNDISTNVKRQKLSIGASESFCCNASPP